MRLLPCSGVPVAAELAAENWLAHVPLHLNNLGAKRWLTIELEDIPRIGLHFDVQMQLGGATSTAAL